MKENSNVYFKARKTASTYNERLCSRETTAELLGLSPSTLADYELGITKVVPVDKVVLMSDLYKCPELKHQYCKHECPIGRELPIATETPDFKASIIKLMRAFKQQDIEQIKDDCLEIADGDSCDKLEQMIEKLDRLAYVINETRLACQKAVEENARGNA